MLPNVVKCLVFVMFLCYPTVTKALLSVFHCHGEKVEEVHLLSSDLSVPCFDSTHSSAMLVSGTVLLLYAVGFPLYIVAILKRGGSRVGSHLYFLTEGYNMERFPVQTPPCPMPSSHFVYTEVCIYWSLYPICVLLLHMIIP
jgi:hypothetical protein